VPAAKLIYGYTIPRAHCLRVYNRHTTTPGISAMHKVHFNQPFLEVPALINNFSVSVHNGQSCSFCWGRAVLGVCTRRRGKSDGIIGALVFLGAIRAPKFLLFVKYHHFIIYRSYKFAFTV